MAQGPPKDLFSRSIKESKFKIDENGSIRKCVKLKIIISIVILIQAPTDPIYFNGSLQRSKLKIRGNGSIKIFTKLKITTCTFISMQASKIPSLKLEKTG